jgi:hypothetical protein
VVKKRKKGKEKRGRKKGVGKKGVVRKKKNPGEARVLFSALISTRKETGRGNFKPNQLILIIDSQL